MVYISQFICYAVVFFFIAAAPILCVVFVLDHCFVVIISAYGYLCSVSFPHNALCRSAACEFSVSSRFARVKF